MSVFLAFFFLCFICTSSTSSLFIKRPASMDILSTAEYQRCPTALEIEHTDEDTFLDLEYLDGLCKNVAAVTRMRISGNFYGIAEVLFNKLPKLVEFEGNDMENLTEINIATWNLNYIDFSRNSLEKVTIEFMDEIVYLNLSRNRLVDENILMTSMRTPLTLKLRTLDLSHNELTTIDNLFQFWNLRKFILNDNKISYIKPGILQKYPNLVTLNIARNKLQDLPDGMFTGLIRLVNLDISHNLLNEAKIKTINSLRSLEFLNLSGNEIKDFNYEELDHNLELLRINDDHNYVHGKKVSLHHKKRHGTTTTEDTNSLEEYDDE